MVRQSLFLLIGLMLPALMLATDHWAYFHPEVVRSMGCTASTSTLTIDGITGRDAYIATASAKRNGFDDWSMTVGVFPQTVKGRHQAEAACSKWMDQASKRVKAAQKAK